MVIYVVAEGLPCAATKGEHNHKRNDDKADRLHIATRVRLSHGGSVRGSLDRNGNGPQQAGRGIAAGAETMFQLKALATGDDVQSRVGLALGGEELVSRTEILLENGHAESLPEQLAILGHQSAVAIVGERDDGVTELDTQAPETVQFSRGRRNRGGREAGGFFAPTTGESSNETRFAKSPRQYCRAGDRIERMLKCDNARK
jgi:hypothetical protein